MNDAAAPAVNPRAVRLKRILLATARKESDPDVRSHLKGLAALTRVVFEGPSKKQIQSALLCALEEYRDGDEDSTPLSAVDLEDATGWPRSLFRAELESLLAEGIVLADVRIPAHNQAGDHSVQSFRINPQWKSRLHTPLAPVFVIKAPLPEGSWTSHRKHDLGAPIRKAA